jgi:hypothetical protein
MENLNNKDYKYFAARLVNDEYVLRQEDRISTNIIFSSEWINPNLDKVENYYFKINYLCNILSNELNKMGYNINATRIKDRVIVKGVTVYHSRLPDEDTSRDADYFFIIDGKIFRAYVYKRFPYLSHQDREKAGKEIQRGKQTIYKSEELAVDDYFSKAFSFTGDVLSEDDIISEADLIREFNENNAVLEIFLESGEKLDYIKEKTQIDIDINKVNQYEIKIISTKKPLIGKKAIIKITENNQEKYSLKGEITGQKTVSFKQYYAHNLSFSFNTKKRVLNAKAILVFVNLEKK